MENLKAYMLPLLETVIFPSVEKQLLAGRTASVASISKAIESDSQTLFIVTQKRPDNNEKITMDELHSVGVLAKIKQMFRTQEDEGNNISLTIEGFARAELLALESGTEGELIATVLQLDESYMHSDEADATLIELRAYFKEYLELNKKNLKYQHLKAKVENNDATPDLLADHIADALQNSVNTKQAWLACLNVNQRIAELLKALKYSVGLQSVGQDLQQRQKLEIERQQREFFLREQMRMIQNELGDIDLENDDDEEVPQSEQERLKKRIEEAKLPAHVNVEAMNEFKRLNRIPSHAPEASVIRDYLDNLLKFPWHKTSRINRNLKKGIKILNQDHYGLEDVKDRIIEYLAVMNRVKQQKGNIICLVGPPGVGKTSIGKSIARATGRQYTRMALGGISDEAEIRGHRRTYIGSMPGRVVQSLNRVGTKNPLFLLDEIDKIASHYRGDPSAALLELIDPEQNNAFNDHYMGVDLDLSNVMFVATANTTNIHPALLDRMELIEISGYTKSEKLEIAKKYLLPRQLERNGLEKNELRINNEMLLMLIEDYTKEAGVRSLERVLAKLCRKVLKKILTQEDVYLCNVKTEEELRDFLGVAKYSSDKRNFKNNTIGRINGLAWTLFGGEVLSIEANQFVGDGQFIYTGQLGDVMKESFKIAMSVIKSSAKNLQIDLKQLKKQDLHIHIPAGAIPKDGPSAGLAIAMVIASTIMQVPSKADVAMTGEITLTGEVLEIGGLKEKLLAANQNRLSKVLIPESNIKDLEKIPDEILQTLHIIPVKHINEAWQHVLVLDQKQTEILTNLPLFSLVSHYDDHQTVN